MCEKFGQAAAKVCKAFFTLLRWAAILGFIYLVYLFGSLPGSFIDKLKGLTQKVFGQSFLPPPKAEPKVDFYTVLVGSFRSDQGAEALQKELKTDRIHATILSQNNTYFVIVGNYVSRNQVESALKTIRNKGYSGARIVLPK